MSGEAIPRASEVDPVDPGRLAAQSDTIHHTALPHTRSSLRMDMLVRRFARTLSWIWLALLVVIVFNVGLRYLLGEGRIELEELQWHLYAVGFLGGLVCCVPDDAHIRVDVLRDRLSPRMQAWIELYGILLLVLPFCALILFFGLPFVAESWRASEVSPSPGGLPLRWLVKSALPASVLLLMFAYVSRLLRISSLLFGAPRASQTAHIGEDR